MRKTFILLSIFVLSGSLAKTILAQKPPASPTATNAPAKLDLIQGDVQSIGADKIVLQTKDGVAMDVVLSGKTTYFRVAPENPSLKTAAPANLSDIGAGDKLIVTGILSADKKSVPAAKVYLMTKSDIAQKQNKEREEWGARGITGQVSAVNPQTKEITVAIRGGMTGEQKIVLTPKENADFRRYAADSVDYNQAKASAIDEIKVGDTIRALGDKSEDGATLKAERVVTGAFQTVGGTITAIDAAKNEITLNNIQTKKDVTIVVVKNSILKQFPAEAAQRMAQFQAMRAASGGITPGGGSGQGGAVRPPQQTGGQEIAGQNPNRMRPGGGGMRAGNIDEMLERFPNITIADLKVGDMIAVSSAKTTNGERVNAIKLLSGVEPFLKAAQQSAAAGGRSGGRGGQDSGFQIPGLDGSNFP